MNFDFSLHLDYRNPAVGQTTLSVDEPTTEELDSETVPPVNELPFPHHRHGCSPDTTSPVHPVSRWRQGPDERPIRRGVGESRLSPLLGLQTVSEIFNFH